MWLKIIAFVYAFAGIWAVLHVKNDVTTLRVIGVVLLVPATIGLFQVAFKKSLLPRRFWMFFTVIYLGHQALSLLAGARILIVEQGKSIPFYMAAAAFSFIVQFPIFFSLWRLSFRTSQSDPATVQ